MALPCHPCPHSSACCAEGAPLKPWEADALRTAFGAAKLVWNVTDKQWRTALGDHGGCVFLVGNRCEIHAHEAYPVVCEGFPFRPDESEVDICPELLTGKHPDLDVLFDPVTKQLRVAH